MMTDSERTIVQWLANGDTCDCSKTLAFWAAFDLKPDNRSYPRDPDDIRRCLKLLRAAPELRTGLHKMSELSIMWAMIVPHWAELESTLLAEIGDLDNKSNFTRNTDILLKEVLSGVHKQKEAVTK